LSRRVPVYTNGASALRGRYLVKNRGVNAALAIRDAFLRLLPERTPAAQPRAPRRIVVAIGGHLGDGVIATSVMAPLAEAFPGVRVGVICPTPMAIIFEGHPLVDRIHRYDHWLGRRTGRGVDRSVTGLRVWRSQHLALATELRECDYDVGVDLYPFFPNHAELLHRAGIETRVGYTSGGGGPLLTHPLEWEDSRLHTADQHLRLIRSWASKVESRWAYDLPALSDADKGQGARLLTECGLVSGEYVVAHPGTGNALKAWPTERWVELARRWAREPLARRPGRPVAIVLTGAGDGEARIISAIQSVLPSAASLCNRTTWPSLRYVIAGARALVGADSVASHVAAAHGVPSVSIMAAMTDPEHWRAPQAVALTASVACAPCFQSRGCATMACVRDVEVGRVDAAVRELVQTHSIAPE
jgi:ADP-heptose:LPS heptosyltransferase